MERARVATERWGFAEAERLLNVARSDGADPTQVAHVTDALAAAREAEKLACGPIDDDYTRDLLASEGLVKAEALLKEHPDSVKLRLVAGHLSGTLGRYAQALAHLDAVIDLDPGKSDEQLIPRRFLRRNLELTERNTWTGEPPFDAWRPVNGGLWRAEGPGQVRGRLAGMAEFGFAGLIHKQAGSLRAPYEVSVEIELDTKQSTAYGGIILGLKDADTCLLVYLLHDTRLQEELGYDERKLKKLYELRGFEGPKALRYARWRDSAWEQIGDDVLAEFADEGWTRLSVRAANNELAASVNGKAVPAVGLPDSLDGRVGVIKWFNDVVGFRNFSWDRR